MRRTVAVRCVGILAVSMPPTAAVLIAGASEANMRPIVSALNVVALVVAMLQIAHAQSAGDSESDSI